MEFMVMFRIKGITFSARMHVHLWSVMVAPGKQLPVSNVLYLLRPCVHYLCLCICILHKYKVLCPLLIIPFCQQVIGDDRITANTCNMYLQRKTFHLHFHLANLPCVSGNFEYCMVFLNIFIFVSYSQRFTIILEMYTC